MFYTYAPSTDPPRSEAPALAEWVYQQFLALAGGGFSYLSLELLNTEPGKYFDGMMVLADGTNWNPGGGQGVYVRYNNTWNKLG